MNAQDPRRVLNQLRFGEPVCIQGRSSIADQFKPSRRTGVYVLHFLAGDLYAGQAVDVTRRYAQHRKQHGDIERISFRRVPQGQLDKVERELPRLSGQANAFGGRTEGVPPFEVGR
jgi:hypothetical protein